MRYIRGGIAATGPRPGSSVIAVMPGWMPWLGHGPGLHEWITWYGAVGTIRGAAATHEVYGVRVNGLAIASGQEHRSAPIVRYAMGENRDWLNGYLLACDAQGLGLLIDEQPRWQCFSGDIDSALPAGFLSLIEDDDW
jgi:hypothetical protein